MKNQNKSIGFLESSTSRKERSKVWVEEMKDLRETPGKGTTLATILKNEVD